MFAAELEDPTPELAERLQQGHTIDWSRSWEEIRKLTDPLPAETIEAIADEYRDGTLREMFEELVELGLPFDPERHTAAIAERLARRRLVRMADQAGADPTAIARKYAAHSSDNR